MKIGRLATAGLAFLLFFGPVLAYASGRRGAPVENRPATDFNELSVSWDGWLYDCDFNQMLELKVKSSVQHISEFNKEALSNRTICISQHCYGCTAGAGSSCQGTVT